MVGANSVFLEVLITRTTFLSVFSCAQILVDKEKGWELFESHLDSTGNWFTPEAMKSINEKCSFLAGPSLSYDGNTLYFTAFIETITKSEDIYYSERLDGNNWTEPKSIGAPINTEENYEGFPSISADGNSLYFIRISEDNFYDKKSKENCFVIFVSHRQHDSTWSEPQALPAPINSGCERDPKIMADNHTLIFSSIREGGKGKYDLFQSRKQPDNSWSNPVALDFINSPESDQSPCISASGDVMFFYSLSDIYSVTIPPQYRQMINVTVKGTVKTNKGQPVRVNILVRESSAKEEFIDESSPADGAYLLVLSAGKKYTLTFSHDGFLNETVTLDFENKDKYAEILHNVVLRSEYTLSLYIDDHDLKTFLSAFISVTNHEEKYEDSLRQNQYPYKLTLKAGRDYDLRASAKMFPEIKENWKFDSEKIKPEMQYTLHLMHEKVRYIADVTNVVSKQKSKIKVYFNNENVDEVIIAESGEVVLLRKGDRYQVMTGSDKGFFFSSLTIVAGEGESDGRGGFRVTMTIVPIEMGAQLTLNHITFASNSADLKPSSLLELDRVIELMQKNPTLHIEISAHTDDVGSDPYNLKLSQNRATSAVIYLKKHGTPVARLKHVGYGKERPVVPNDSDENRAINRRVELRVLKIE